MSRIPLIDKSQVNQEIAELYTELEKTRGGKVPNLFRAMGYSKLMLEPAMRVADFVTTESKVLIKHKQLAYLATSRINKCEYCLARHSVAGLKAGLTEANIQALYHEGDLSSNPSFNEQEKAIIRLAEELAITATVQNDRVDILKQFFNDEQILELTYSVAVANMFNRLASGLGIELEPEFKELNFLSPGA